MLVRGHWEVCTYDKEVGEGEGDAAEGAPEEEDLGAEVGVAFGGADKVGGDDTNDLKLQMEVSPVCGRPIRRFLTHAVPEPIGSGRQTNTTGADG